MKNNITNQLKNLLISNGFSTKDNILYEGTDSKNKVTVSYTFLNNGWVKKYYRCYPASEGWYIRKYKVGDFLKKEKLF